MIIALGGDHAGFKYKASINKMLEKEGHTCLDFGTNSEASVDYPDYIHPLAKAIESGEAKLGVIICGSGNGVAMTANKHSEIRAAICWKLELAVLARQHNDANVVSIPARFISLRLAKDIVKIFVNTAFEGGRHARRVAKINAC